MHAEVADKVRLAVTGGFDTASSHEQQDEWRADFVAGTDAEGIGIDRGMKLADRVEFGVHFEIFGEFMASYEASEVAIAAQMHEIIAKLPIQIDRAELFGEFDRKEQAGTARGDPAVDGTIWIIERHLREDGHGETGLFVVVEAPLQAELILPQAVAGIAQRVIDPEIGILKGKLDAVAEAEIDVDVGDMSYGLGMVEEGHVSDIDFPLLVAGGARIVGVIRWAALGVQSGTGTGGENQTGDETGDSRITEARAGRGGGAIANHGDQFSLLPQLIQQRLLKLVY